MEQPEKKGLSPDARRTIKEANIELTRKLMLRGITTNYEIAKYFETKLKDPQFLSFRTISRYKAALKRRHAKRLLNSESLNVSVEHLVVSIKDNYEEVSREAWAIYHRKDTAAHDKLRALQLVVTINDSWAERLQKLGLVATAPTQVQMLGKDGKPAEPQVQVNVDLNAAFTAFIKARYQDPIGATGDATTIQGKTIDGGQLPQAAGG